MYGGARARGEPKRGINSSTRCTHSTLSRSIRPGILQFLKSVPMTAWELDKGPWAVLDLGMAINGFRTTRAEWGIGRFQIEMGCVPGEQLELFWCV